MVDDEAKKHGLLELDRIEVEVQSSKPGSGETAGETPQMTDVAADEGASGAGLSFADFRGVLWILLGGLVLGVAAAFLLSTLRGGPVAWNPHEVSSALGDRFRVDFTLLVKESDVRDDEAVERALPRLRHALITMGSRREVMTSAERRDLDRLGEHLRRITSKATGLPEEDLAIAGLSVRAHGDRLHAGNAPP